MTRFYPNLLTGILLMLGNLSAQAAVSTCTPEPNVCPLGDHMYCTITHGWCGPSCGTSFCSQGSSQPAEPILTNISLQMKTESLPRNEEQDSSFSITGKANYNPWNDSNDEQVVARAEDSANRAANLRCSEGGLTSTAKQISLFVIAYIRSQSLYTITATADFQCEPGQ